MAEPVEHEWVLRDSLWEEALHTTILVSSRYLPRMLRTPWQRADKHVLNYIKATCPKPRPQRMQGSFLVEELMRAIVDDDVQQRRQGHLAELGWDRCIRFKRQVNSRIRPHGAVVLRMRVMQLSGVG